jgi:hypothetical protein
VKRFYVDVGEGKGFYVKGFYVCVYGAWCLLCVYAKECAAGKHKPCTNM